MNRVGLNLRLSDQHYLGLVALDRGCARKSDEYCERGDFVKLLNGAPLLTRHRVDVLKHLVGSLNNLRIGLIGALRQDHLDEFFNYVDVGLFERALLNCAETFAAARCSKNCVAGRRCRRKQILPCAIQSAGICKRR